MKNKIEKLENIILYILSKCGQKPNITDSFISRLLYLCDFNYYEIFLESISWQEYVKYPHWPRIENIYDIFYDMAQREKIQIINTDRLIPLVYPDMSGFTCNESIMIDCILNEFSDKPLQYIDNYISEDFPYKRTKKFGSKIPYSLANNREFPYSAIWKYAQLTNTKI